jgi:hypothetical protein
VLESKKVPELLPGMGPDDASWASRTAQQNRDGVPAPGTRGPLGTARRVANRAFNETIVVDGDGHGDGHAISDGHGDEHAIGNGHPGQEPAGVGSGTGELPAGDASDEPERTDT